MFGLGAQELLIILLIVLVLFGAKRIPEIAKGLGRGIRDFKSAMKETTDEVTKASSEGDKEVKKENSENK